MKKTSTILGFIKNPLFLVFVLSTLLFGCYKLRHIIQPTTGLPNSSFNVTIVLDTLSGQDYSTAGDTGLFGVLLPVGWTVEDSFAFHKVSLDGTHNVDGKVVYDEAQSTRLEAKTAAPTGYFWWGGKTEEPLTDMNGLDSIYMVVKILTDDQTGTFNLKYAIGDLENDQGDRSPYKELSDDYPITIGTSNSAKSIWNVADIDVYPNPTSGEFDIRFLDNHSNGEKKLTIYNLGGKQIYSKILYDQVNHIDLNQFSKGTYILALENEGQVVTKKIVLQ